MNITQELTNEDLANDVLRKAKAFSYPVSLDKVIKKYNIELHEEALEDDVSGMLVIKKNTKHIIINSLHSDNRQNFTKAHELGHFFLHHKEGQDRLFIDKTYHRASRTIDKASQLIEQEANRFASYLLMPKVLVNDYIRSNLHEDTTELEEHDVSRIAEKFKVSEQAMMIRLKKLDYKVIDNY